MMSRLKMTGFGRFFVFLLILAPIAYFGAQYLQNSGALDKMKEKVESPQSDRQTNNEAENGSDILNEINKKANNQADIDQEAIIAEQRRKIEELERRNQELLKTGSEQANTSLPPIETPSGSPTADNSSGAPSLDDLIRQAEINLNGKETSSELGSPKKSLATWSFDFSNVRGTIELYEQEGKLMARTAYNGTSQVDISELVQQDDKLYVRNSPTGEYYMLKSDGNLEAYDRDGYQTTCSRM